MKVCLAIVLSVSEKTRENIKEAGKQQFKKTNKHSYASIFSGEQLSIELGVDVGYYKLDSK